MGLFPMNVGGGGTGGAIPENTYLEYHGYGWNDADTIAFGSYSSAAFTFSTSSACSMRLYNVNNKSTLKIGYFSSPSYTGSKVYGIKEGIATIIYTARNGDSNITIDISDYGTIAILLTWAHATTISYQNVTIT